MTETRERPPHGELTTALDWADPDPARPHQPEVKILSDPKGIPLATPAVASLDESDSATGRPKRTVIKTTDAARYDIRVADSVTT